MAIDSELCLDYYKTDGGEILALLFKNTIYSKDVLFSVCNNESLQRDDMMFVPPSQFDTTEIL